MTHEAQLDATDLSRSEIGGFPFTSKFFLHQSASSKPIIDQDIDGTVGGFRALAASAQRQFAPNRAAIYCESMLYDRYDCALGRALYRAEGPPRAISESPSRHQGQGLSESGDHDLLDGGIEEFHSSISCRPDRQDKSYDFTFSFNDGSVPAINNLWIRTSLGCRSRHDSQIGWQRGNPLPRFSRTMRLANGHVDPRPPSADKRGISFEARAALILMISIVQRKLNGNAGLSNAFRQLNIDPASSPRPVLSGLFGRGSDSPAVASAGHSFRRFCVDRPVRTPIQIPRSLMS